MSDASRPTMAILGIKETTANKFLAHYHVLSRIYKHSHLVQLSTRSTRFTRNAFETLDFWNLDADFIFMEDMLSFNDLVNYSSTHFDYFNGFMKVLRVAHGYFGKEDYTSPEWSKNKAHVLDVYSSMLLCDVIQISPILAETYSETLPSLFNKKVVKSITDRFLITPPPDLYKYEDYTKQKDFKKLSFLWNHRLIASKNPKLFFGIIRDFNAKYPKVPIEIRVLSHEPESKVLAVVPSEIHKFTKVYPFTTDDAEYRKHLEETNITLGTSEVESFGIAILESVLHNSVVLNMPMNTSFIRLIGDKTTFREKEMVDVIYRVYTDEKFRNRIIRINKEQYGESVPSRKAFLKLVRGRLQEKLEQRFEDTSAKSPKLAAVMKALDKKPLTKNEVYGIMGWKDKGAIINTYWSEYYYGLRKLGARATVVNGRLMFHLDDLDEKSIPKGTSSKPTSKTLFNR